MKKKNKLILLPGLGCAKDFYNSTVRDLKEDWDVDFMEYGVHSVEKDADILYKQMKGITSNFTVLAHCFSGLIMLNLLSRYKLPNLTGLVLCNSVSNFTVITKEDVWGNEKESEESYIAGGVAVEKVLEAKSHPIDSLEDVSNQLDIALNVNYDSITKTLDVPVLVIGSDEDGYFSEEHFYNTYKNLKHSDYIFLHGVKHLGLVTHTKKYSKLIFKWVSEIRGSVCLV